MYTLNREDAISLLKEVMVACPSLYTAQAVSITENERDSWVLGVFWVLDALDGDCLEKIVVKLSLEVGTTNGRTVFRSR